MLIRTAIEHWFSAQHWQPFSFQQAVWQAMQEEKCGLIHAATGTGKTYAAWLGALQYCLRDITDFTQQSSNALQIVWLTPLRALAVDTENSLLKPLVDLQIPWRIETRSSDTSGKLRARQNRQLPEVLITTPESLTLLLTRAHAEKSFAQLKIIIVDEWHQLLGTKRGVQTELALARLRTWHPQLLIWGLSATLPDVTQALQVLLGNHYKKNKTLIVESRLSKKITIEPLLPDSMERFPWAGHLGLKLLPKLLPYLESVQSSLIFTNTRSQTELWYQALLAAKPEWAGAIAVHHSSLPTTVRHWVESALRTGQVRCVICTSSMDLGVDYSPVELSVQIGSPKNIARLLQRAGRSGHQPYANSKIICVPTNALELLEIAAVKAGAAEKSLETYLLPNKPLDVLIQHIISMSLGDGFIAEQLFKEVRSTYSYRDLTTAEWQWALMFVTTGGKALQAYPDYQKVQVTAQHYTIANKTAALRHRLVMGTIISDAEVPVRYVKGGYVGQVEESFVARLRAKDCFILGGKVLEFVRIHDNIAYVRRATKPSSVVPRWQGQRLALSANLSVYLQQQWELLTHNEINTPELTALLPIVAIQKTWSKLPSSRYLLIEKIKTREGHHLFFYPLQGRAIHEGMAALFAYRLTQRINVTLSIAANDYGFEIISASNIFLDENLIRTLFNPHDYQQDLITSINLSELAKRHFKEIAYIAGLVFKGYPKKLKSNRQLQVSTNLLYDVFKKFDPDNLLLKQAWNEVLEIKLEQLRLQTVLEHIQHQAVIIINPARLTPLAFPLTVDRLRNRLSSEKLTERVQRMLKTLEKAACNI